MCVYVTEFVNCLYVTNGKVVVTKPSVSVHFEHVLCADFEFVSCAAFSYALCTVFSLCYVQSLVCVMCSFRE